MYLMSQIPQFTRFTMTGLFFEQSVFTGRSTSLDDVNCDLSDWNVSNVESMSHMFYECHLFNSDLSRWQPKSVIDTIGMFSHCTAFKSDLSDWKMPNLIISDDMFYKCSKMQRELKPQNI